MMKLIVAVNENWGIGSDNDLLYHIPEDMKFFRGKTKDNVIIVGRKTLESFPGGNPLKNRTNIVLTTDKNYKKDDVIVVNSKEELFLELKNHKDKEIYLCGGEQIYKLLYSYCDIAYVTKIEDNKPAQKYMQNLYNESDWEIIEQSELLEDNGLKFKFVTYKNKSPLAF